MRTNIQENRSIFNKIRHIQSIGNKPISIPTKLTITDHIGNVVMCPLRSYWYYSTSSNDDKMEKRTTLSATFLLSSLPSDTKILRPRIYLG